MRIVIPAGLIFTATACMTTQTARPLAPDQQQVSLALGGPVVDVTNVAKMPLPNLTLEYRRGLQPNLDAHVGTHLLPMVFGAIGFHGGATWLFSPQQGKLPALSLTERIFFFSNEPDQRKATDVRGLWALNELELNTSWLRGKTLYYLAMTNHFDPALPNLMLSPAAGVDFALGPLRICPEIRWFMPHKDNSKAVLHWQAPADQGAIGLGLSIGRRFGGK